MAAGKTILVVDDDPDIVETTKTILETAGYKVATAANGTEALAQVKSAKPDLVILDIMMDKETEGFHVSYEMKSNDETKEIPVIVLTAVGKKSGFKFAPETDEDYLPVDAYMEKPLEPKKLLKAVADLLAKKGGPAK
jgi:CheY-like chemotaxis protein